MCSSDELFDEGIGRRSDQGRDHDEILEDVGNRTAVRRHADPQFSQQKTRGRRFDVEATDRVTTSDGLLCGDIIQGVPDLVIDRQTRMFGDGCESISNHGERPVAQDIDLDEPGIFRLLLFPTG